MIGAGFIGAEVAATSRALGLDVTIVEAMPVPLSVALGPELGAVCAGLHATNGVPLLTGTTVVDWLTTDDGAGRPRVTALELSDGRRLRADVVVVGIGMAPAAGWLADSGLFLDNGVLTDAGYVTDRPNIVAVGDVARPYNPRTGRNVRREHWTDAAEGPAVAVRNLLAGSTVQHVEKPSYFWSDQYGTRIQFAGSADPADEVRFLDGVPADGAFVATYHRGEATTAVLAMNSPRAVHAPPPPARHRALIRHVPPHQRTSPDQRGSSTVMPQQVRGVVSLKKGDPVSVETIVIPDPGPGEAVVAVQACGVCHTDLHYREGGINDEFPFLLGHEAAGIVESVGEGVTDVAPGDFVILNWRAVCGNCRACRRGEPWYCFTTHNAAQKMTLTSGQELSAALGIGAFVEKTLVHAGQCTKVNPAAKPEVAGLLGCGVMAGIGAAINTGNIGRGDSIAVIGCGGVGNAAIAGARLAGASTIIAVDVDDRKLEWAKDFGATHTINSRETDPVEGIQALTDGNGANVVVDAVGRPETFTQAFYARDLAGTVVLVGVPTPQMRVELPLIDIFGRGGATKSSWYGDCLPSRDFPMLIDLHLQGRLPLEKFVSETHRPRRRREGFPPYGGWRGPTLRGDSVIAR